MGIENDGWRRLMSRVYTQAMKDYYGGSLYTSMGAFEWLVGEGQLYLDALDINKDTRESVMKLDEFPIGDLNDSEEIARYCIGKDITEIEKYLMAGVKLWNTIVAMNVLFVTIEKGCCLECAFNEVNTDKYWERQIKAYKKGEVVPIDWDSVLDDPNSFQVLGIELLAEVYENIERNHKNNVN